jgi:hypothetical protein
LILTPGKKQKPGDFFSRLLCQQRSLRLTWFACAGRLDRTQTSFNIALDLQAACPGLIVVDGNLMVAIASLDIRFDLQAADDPLVVLQLASARFHIRFDLHNCFLLFLKVCSSIRRTLPLTYTGEKEGRNCRLEE